MALSNAQLLMLDTLIYTDFCKDDLTVGEIVENMSVELQSGKNINVCEMTTGEWLDLIDAIKDEPALLNYTVKNCKTDETGMRVACFVDDIEKPKDVNVIFRGTSSAHEWYDNGKGGYLSDTDIQMKAAQYVNGLPESYGNALTVSGHSKGGNEAQYVTIVTDRIAKCVSYDGQGFSEEFINTYRDKIEKKASSIVSISASNDYVNCLLYPIAASQIYLDTESQDNYLHYHKPNILLDKNGNLKRQTEQSDISKLINEYSTYIISNLDEPERSMTIDGAIEVVLTLQKYENLDINEIRMAYAGVNAISHIDDFALDSIGQKYGVTTEYLTTYVAAMILPKLFLDDFLNINKEILMDVVHEMYGCALEINKKLQRFGDKAVEFGKKFVIAVERFTSGVKEWINSKINSGYKAATSNPIIRVDTAKLRAYADRLEKVNRRVINLDKRMDKLYLKVGLRDLFDLLEADLLTGSNKKILNCAKYLDQTANDFDKVERDIVEWF